LARVAELVLQDVHGDDLLGARQRTTLDRVQSDAATADDDHRLARPHSGGVDDGADPGHHRASDNRGLLHRHVRIDLHDPFPGKHRQLTKRGYPGEVPNLLVAPAESAGPVLEVAGPANAGAELAESGAAGQTVEAIAAARAPQEQNVIA